MLRIALFSLFCVLSSQLAAETVTAVCREPTGRILGQHGKMGKHQPLDEKDGMKGGLVTIAWEFGEDLAQIVTQSAAGKPHSEKGLRVHFSDEQLSFLVLYESAVWLYSLFPKPKVLLMTQHVNGVLIDSGGAVNKSLKARCEISVQ